MEPDSLAAKTYGKPRSASAIATAMNSTANTKSVLTGGGLRITGATPDGTYVEIVEIPDHPYFLGCQFHPEFKSKPLEPHPLFSSVCGPAMRTAASARRQEQLGRGDVPAAGEGRDSAESDDCDCEIGNVIEPSGQIFLSIS